MSEHSNADKRQISAGLRAELDAFDALTSADPRNVSLRYTTGMLYQLAGQPQQVRNVTEYAGCADTGSPDWCAHLDGTSRILTAGEVHPGGDPGANRWCL